MKRLFLAILLPSLAATFALSCTNHTRLLYWNIQNGMWSDQANGYDNFVSYVKSLDPDICIWCEASTIYLDGTDTGMPRSERYLPSHWDELSSRYGHKYVCLGAWNDNYPQVITSRYPIEAVELIHGDDDHTVCHGSLWARVRIGGKELNLVPLHTWPKPYSVHLRGADFKPGRPESAQRHAGDSSRREELRYICSRTIDTRDDYDNEYWLMAGDFNARSRNDNFHYRWPADTAAFWAHDFLLEETSMVDVISEIHPGEFHRSHSNMRRIDFVYASKAMYGCISDARIIDDEVVAPVKDTLVPMFFNPSDHLPIVVDFKLK